MNLKKIGTTVLAGIFSFSMATGAFAQSSEPKEADVKLEIKQLVEVVYEGKSVEVEAHTHKKGSSYEVEWSVAGLELNGTTFDVADESAKIVEGTTSLVALPVEDSDVYVDTYVSKATFTGNKAGTYLITATVEMKAGKSHVSWTGSDSADLKVEALKEVKGLIAKTTKVETGYNNQGKVTGYNVTYDVYIQYVSGEEELFTADAKTNVGASGNSKTVDVVHNGTTYKVLVSR